MRHASHGTLKEIDLDAILSQWRSSDRPMRFYRSMQDGIAAPFQANTVRLPAFDAMYLHLLYDRAFIRGNDVKTVVTAPQPYSYAAAVEFPESDLPDPAWVSVRQSVTKGRVGIGILDRHKNDFADRRFFDTDFSFGISSAT